MKILISKSQLKGQVRAPSSKSYTLRGLMCAALAKGYSEMVYPLDSDDTEAALDVLSKTGVRVHKKESLWEVSGGSFHQPDTDLFCRDSAGTLRFMTAICSLVPGKCRLTAGPSLSKRPVKPLVEALKKLGVDCSCQGEVAPVIVDGGTLKGGATELPGNISSQFVSALLFIAPLAEAEVKIRLTTPAESQLYILMTLDCLEKFGIKVNFSRYLRQFDVPGQTFKPAKYRIEGDWSSASYFLAMGAVCGEVKILNLNPASLQGDRMILDFLKDMGASIMINEDSVTVSKSRLKAIHADLSDCIDLLPTLAVLAAVAEGESEFVGIERARIKESNRVSAMKEGLEAMGIKVVEEANRVIITGSRPEGAEIDSRSDHRIAMAFSILGPATGDMVINDAGCVTKTFPQFWEQLESIGGKVKRDGK